MQAVAKVITDIFMMVLCATSAPVDQQEIRIDIVGDGGYIDTMIVQRTDVGFTVHDEMNGKLVKFMAIVPKEGTKNTFVCTLKDGLSETVNLGQGIKELNIGHLRTKDRLRLKTIDGANLAVDRSRDVAFITHNKFKHTYVVH